MQIFRTHLNFWFIIYRSANKQSKMYLKFAVFLSLLKNSRGFPPLFRFYFFPF